jgi:hypothetical protein
VRCEVALHLSGRCASAYLDHVGLGEFGESMPGPAALRRESFDRDCEW